MYFIIVLFSRKRNINPVYPVVIVFFCLPKSFVCGMLIKKKYGEVFTLVTFLR